MQHTPTPWTTDGQNIYGFGRGNQLAAVYHRLKTPHEKEANAAFIVRACNAHDDLVRCLKELYEFWQTDARDYDLNEYEAIEEGLHHDIKAALAKAEGR